MNPLETYLRELRDIHSTGAAVPETSYYGRLEGLLNDVGKMLKPKVRCVINLANRGAGIPDGGLFTPDQLVGAKRSEDRIRKDDPDPMQGQAPSRGVIEVKSTSDDVATIAAGEQVARYGKKYGLVLVTNYRDFVLVARDPSGKPAMLESYRLAGSEQEFWASAGPAKAVSQPPHSIGGPLGPAQINDADDLAVTAGWGNPGRGGITMPAGGKLVARDYAEDERQTPRALGETTRDIYLNDHVYWRNIPQAVWEYTLGGYQVIKQWLSYREHKMLGRPLRADEARYVTEMARRIAAILRMQPALDENYQKVKETCFPWAGRSVGAPT